MMESYLENEDFVEILRDPLYAKELYIFYNLRLPFPEEAPYACSTIVRRVRDTASRAFWDVIKETSIKARNHDCTLGLLETAKKILLSLAGARNTVIKDDIQKVLDVKQISKELKDDDLNLRNRLSMILDLMAKVCAPARDQEIESLRLMRVETPGIQHLREIFAVLENMRIDMCNFLLKYYRKKIIDNCLKFESSLFHSCLEKMYEASHNLMVVTTPPSCAFVLPKTRRWLKAAIEAIKAAEPLEQHPLQSVSGLTPDWCHKTLDKGYVDLLVLDEQDYPETVALDIPKLRCLSMLCKSCILVASVLNILKKHTTMLHIHDPLVESHVVEIALRIEDTASNQEAFASKAISAVAQNLIQFLESHRAKFGLEPLKNKFKEFFPAQMVQLLRKTDPVWLLFQKRVLQGIFSKKVTELGPSPEIHFSLQCVRDPIEYMREVYSRFTSFNRAVYESYYQEVIRNILTE